MAPQCQFFTFTFDTQMFSSVPSGSCHNISGLIVRRAEAPSNHQTQWMCSTFWVHLMPGFVRKLKVTFLRLVTQMCCGQMSSGQKNKNCRGLWKHLLAWSPKGLANCFADNVNKLVFRAWNLNQRKHMEKHLIISTHYQIITGSTACRAGSYSVSFISPTNSWSQHWHVELSLGISCHLLMADDKKK